MTLEFRLSKNSSDKFSYVEFFSCEMAQNHVAYAFDGPQTRPVGRALHVALFASARHFALAL